MNTIRTLALRAYDYILDLLNSNLDGAIAAFQKAERRLTAYQARLDARIAAEYDAQDASYRRQDAAVHAEFDARKAIQQRVGELQGTRARAARIQSRIGELLK